MAEGLYEESRGELKAGGAGTFSVAIFDRARLFFYFIIGPFFDSRIYGDGMCRDRLFLFDESSGV